MSEDRQKAHRLLAALEPINQAATQLVDHPTSGCNGVLILTFQPAGDGLFVAHIRDGLSERDTLLAMLERAPDRLAQIRAAIMEHADEVAPEGLMLLGPARTRGQA